MKKTIKNKKLLLGLGAIISITSITSILSCSKPDTNSPINPDSNGGSNGVKPEPNPEPEDGKQYLNIQNHKFDTGNESWERNHNFLPQIEINKIRWIDQQNKPIKYKVKLQINPGRILGNELSNETRPYNLKDNFYKTMDTGLDLDFIFWRNKSDELAYQFQIEPLNWEPRVIEDNDISLPFEDAFAFCYMNKNNELVNIVGEVGRARIESIKISNEYNYFNIKLSNDTGFNLKESDKISFKEDNFNINKAYMTEKQREGEKWHISNRYKNLSGTISIERVDN